MVCWKGWSIIILSFSDRPKMGDRLMSNSLIAMDQKKKKKGKKTTTTKKRETWSWAEKKGWHFRAIFCSPIKLKWHRQKALKCCLWANDWATLTRDTPRQWSADPINFRALGLTRELEWRLHRRHKCHWPFHSHLISSHSCSYSNYFCMVHLKTLTLYCIVPAVIVICFTLPSSTSLLFSAN